MDWKKLFEVSNIDIDLFIEWFLADWESHGDYYIDPGGGVVHEDEIENMITITDALDFLVKYFEESVYELK